MKSTENRAGYFFASPREPQLFKNTTWMFRVYCFRLVWRLLIFTAILAVYIFSDDFIGAFTGFRLFQRFNAIHLLWSVLMGGMIVHLLPRPKVSMSELKSREYTYAEPKESFDRLALLEYVQGANLRAWKVMLVWLTFNAVFGALYLLHVISEAELILLSMFYFLSDLVCMMIFCPFQSYIMKNRCCVNCRIFDWGHFMMYTPMLFIKSFFSWSLFFMACVVLLRWEIVYARHPERFWFGSNEVLRCENCKDRMCAIKKPYLPKERDPAPSGARGGEGADGTRTVDTP